MQRFMIISFLVLLMVLTSSCSPYKDQSALTPQEIQWIDDHPEGVKIGVSIHYPPYETYGTKTPYSGLSADFIKLISEKVGLKITPVRFRNRHQVLNGIKNSKVDLVAAVERTPDRENFLTFSQSYISIPAAIITRKEVTQDLTLEKLEGMRVGITVAPSFIEYLTDDLNINCEIVPMTGGYIGGLRSLAVGDVDVLICDMALASHYIANARISNLRIAGLTNYSFDLRMAARKDMPELNSILRKGLALILPHERKIIEKQWLSLHYQPLWSTQTFWWGIFGAFITGLLSLALVLFWNHILKRQVSQRTSVLSSINTLLLNSLNCHSEQEVMDYCLHEAAERTASVQTCWATMENNTLTIVHSVVHDDEQSQAKLPDQIGLTYDQSTNLQSGLYVQISQTLPCSTSPVHLLILPVSADKQEQQQMIIAMRDKHEHTSDEARQLSEMLFAFEEVLHRKQAEISLVEKERQLQRVQRVEALGTLAGGIAHDFNNILSIIVGNGQMIELFHSVEDPVLMEKIDNILAASDRGRTLVNQILTFARQESEEVAPLKISPIIKETIKFLESSLSSAIRIECTLDTPEPYVLAEPTQIHQALMNLCTNAAHALGHGGGVIRINLTAEDYQPVDTTPPNTLKAGRYLVLKISDTGSGIPPQVLERIFEPFFTTKPTGEGTGLGLAFVEGIIKTWNGQVDVESTVGEGTCFTLRLPIYHAPVSETLQSAPLSVQGGKGRILVVDDEQEIAELFGDFLRKLGYQATVTTQSTDALAQIQSRPTEFDMMICDFNMPHMCGNILAENVLALRPDLPIIMCTGFSDTFSEADAQDIGISEYLRKPVGLGPLAQVVGKYITIKQNVATG